MATCPQCHAEFVPNSYRVQVYCQSSCKELARLPRKLAARKSRRAARRAERVAQRMAEAIAQRTREEVAEEQRIAAKPRCAEDGCLKSACKRGFCGAHYQKRCRPNRSHGAVGIVEWKRLNPERSAISDKNKDHRRRARLHNAPSEPIDREVVGRRDGWRCGICGRKINPALRAPHPKSQSLDHIEPLSRGGAHTYANVRIAHLKCNVDRSNVFDHEQLALFG